MHTYHYLIGGEILSQPSFAAWTLHTVVSTRVVCTRSMPVNILLPSDSENVLISSSFSESSCEMLLPATYEFCMTMVSCWNLKFDFLLCPCNCSWSRFIMLKWLLPKCQHEECACQVKIATEFFSFNFMALWPHTIVLPKRHYPCSHCLVYVALLMTWKFQLKTVCGFFQALSWCLMQVRDLMYKVPLTWKGQFWMKARNKEHTTSAYFVLLSRYGHPGKYWVT